MAVGLFPGRVVASRSFETYHFMIPAQLITLVEAMSQKVAACQQVNPSVSAAPVGWHIAHSLLTIKVICSAIEASDPAVYRWQFNWKRSLIYTLGKIPRGKVRAPRIVQPPGEWNPVQLQHEAAEAIHKIRALDQLTRNHYFTHPFFGMLNLAPSKKFLLLHTRHHYRIIEDILKS